MHNAKLTYLKREEDSSGHLQRKRGRPKDTRMSQDLKRRQVEERAETDSKRCTPHLSNWHWGRRVKTSWGLGCADPQRYVFTTLHSSPNREPPQEQQRACCAQLSPSQNVSKCVCTVNHVHEVSVVLRAEYEIKLKGG